MGNPLVEELVALLKSENPKVRLNAIRKLADVGDANAVPELLEALNDEDDGISMWACVSLIRISVPAVSALIDALADKSGHRRVEAAIALSNIGDSNTMPRKVLAFSQFPVDKRIHILEKLRRVHYKLNPNWVKYAFPITRVLCQTVLIEDDSAAREGAQAVLNWLNGDRDLLRASEPDTVGQTNELLRAAQPGGDETEAQEMLRAAGEPGDG